MKPAQITNIREVARHAGVSVGTVSNVLNHPEIVAEATRERVQAAVEQLGYVLNGSARDLRSGRSKLVGLVVLDVRNPFFTEVARGIEDAASRLGYTVVLCNSDESDEKERRYLRVLEEQRVRGLMITPVTTDASRLRWLTQRGMAVVLLDRPSREPDLCSVAVDDTRGGYLAGRHLLRLGHRRLAFLTGPLTIQQCAERRAGLRAAVADAGLDPDRVVHQIEVLTLNARAGEQALDPVLRAEPTAVFCVNDLLALGLMRGLASRGLHVPQDLSVVGYDDVEFASVLQAPLTTVRQPKYELGVAGMELMLSEINQPESHMHQQFLFTPELVVRESTMEA